MAEITWNEDQLAAIEKRGRNILVSAAAGSGKTTVLVERVMRMITDRENPVDLSSLIIMTFTKAAAAQMKEKIYNGIRKELAKDPDNEHLHRQLHAVHSARICTIDSLCMEIVRENFHRVDIDPGFRIADESESLILQNAVLKDVLEEHYQNPTENFSRLVDSYIDKSDSRLDQIILTMYRFAQSHPEPEKWIRSSSAPYIKAASGSPDLNDDESGWLYAMKEFVESEISNIKNLAETGLHLCNMERGPLPHAEVYEEILQLIRRLNEPDTPCNVWQEYICGYLAVDHRARKITAKDDVDESLKETEGAIRKEVTDRIKKLKARYFETSLDDAYDAMGSCWQAAQAIEELTIEFSQRFKAAKYEKNMADFNDVAHLALKVLLRYGEDGSILRDDEGNVLYSDAADEMAGEITEIIVDEYQDTNMLQELIIGALSAQRFGRPDVFMVGDIKQSIYGFRMANPKNFAEKYNSYAEDGKTSERILLNCNYRSRGQVLDLANDIFVRSMIPEIGDVNYSDGHGLVGAGIYPESPEEGYYDPEIVMINEKSEDGKITEGYYIADRIEELVKNGMVKDEADKDNASLRPVRYSDIAILTRSSDNPELEKALDEKKIPVIKASNKGFFSSFEVRLIINLLKIIDNPLQDIPFTAVLTSSLVGIDSNTLARIKAEYREQPFSMYRACQAYEHEGLRMFMDRLREYRLRAEYMDACRLMEYVLEDSGLADMLAAMPGGENRRANIDMLYAQAAAFSANAASGLFSFLRYIKQMQDAEIDYGQAQVADTQANAVRMMTIHKSKGLEFPIVFIARAGKEYNESDIRGSLVLDRSLGMGIEVRDPENRTTSSTLIMNVIKEARKRDAYAEELRLLYVAITRAKEKVIITGSDKNLSTSVKNWALECRMGDEKLSAGSLMSCNNYLDVIGRSLIRHRDSSKLWELCGLKEWEANVIPGLGSSFRLDIVSMLDMEEQYLEKKENAAELSAWAENMIARAAEVAEIRDQIEYRYPYEHSTEKVIKLTASQLEKHEEIPGMKYKKYIPAQEPEEEAALLRGSERGSAYHRVFELLKYDGGSTVQDMMKSFLDLGLIDQAVYNTVESEKIAEFLTSPIGKRMKQAADRGTLRREQQFVMGFTDEDGDERLVQGIIDAFFEEEGQLVLVDYKTDKNKTREQFISTYEGQLQAYVDALEAATGMKVKERVIYALENADVISF